MKLHETLPKTKQFKSFTFLSLIVLTFVAFNPIYSQTTSTPKEVISNQRVIEGIVSDDDQALEGVNVVQEGTRNGTVTNAKGEFTFPNQLKNGDVLLFSYLGYVTQKVEITDATTFINLKLNADMVEMIGALESGKPYKSKRKNKSL